MKMKLLMMVCLFLLPFHLEAQENMASFAVLSNDLSALTERRLDKTGKICALVKIQSTENVEKVEGDLVGKLVPKGKETWAFFKPGSTRMKLFCQSQEPMDVIFADYGVPFLKSKVVYSLEVLTMANDSLDSVDLWVVTALAENYLDEQEYGKAIRYFLNAAKRGNPEAQYNLGYCYKMGWGVTRNDAKMIQWYEKAADAGYKASWLELGVCYMMGNGVDKDYDKAMNSFLRVANESSGDTVAAACHNMAWLYINGLGVKQNVEMSLALYEKAANLGFIGSQYNLGMLYYEGKHVVRDEKKAVMWLTKAAENGCAVAQNNLGNCYLQGLGVSTDYSQAAVWFQKAMEQGHLSAYYNMGLCYETGAGVVKDYVKAVECYRIAAENGVSGAQYHLANCYVDGKGIDVDMDKAAYWYRKAAEQGYKDAESKLRNLGF